MPDRHIRRRRAAAFVPAWPRLISGHSYRGEWSVSARFSAGVRLMTLFRALYAPPHVAEVTETAVCCPLIAS